nr:hypothetical protein [Tanacetum cinerariifolium]
MLCDLDYEPSSFDFRNAHIPNTVVSVTENSPAVPKHTTVETLQTMSPENKAHYESEKEAVHLILTGIGDEIYSTVDACKTAQEMWEAIKRLQQVWESEGNHSCWARKNTRSSLVQQTGIQCFNCKEFDHFAKECRKPKRVKDSMYHKEKMLLCKQAEQGVPLQAEQYDWIADTDKEIDEQELEAHYSYMAKIQEVPTTDSGTDSEPLERVQYDAGYNVFANKIQHSEQSKFIRNICVVETNDSNVTPDSPDMCDNDIQNDQYAVECDDEQTSKTLKESNSVRDSCLVALQTKQTKFEKYKACNDRTVDYDKLKRVAHKTNVSIPQLRSNQMTDKVVSNNSHVKAKKTEVEDHPRNFSISNKTKSVTACNDSLKSRTSNVNFVCATCGKCLINSNHFACVTKLLHDVNARTKKPNEVHISTRKPKSQAKKCVATPHKNTFASEATTQKSKSYYRMLHEKTSQAWKWWTEQQCPPDYKWVTKIKSKWVPKTKTKWHMTGNLTLMCNFVEKYLVGQFCDADLEVAFRKSTYFVRDLQGNDLLTSNHGSDLYTISLQETTSSTLICLMSKASPTQAWLWHRRLSHLNFDYVNLLLKKDVVIGFPKLKYVKDQLCSSCEVSKEKRSSFKTKVVPSTKGRLNLIHTDLCGPMRVASINEKKYILLIVDDYSRYTWTSFLRSKDETPEVLKDFLKMIQRNLQALIIFVRTDIGTEFLNKTLHAFFKEEGIEHQTSTPRTPKQNSALDYDNSDPIPQIQNISPSANTSVPSQQELDLLFGPMYDEFFNAGTVSVNKSSSPTDNSKQQDTQPTTNIQSTTEPTIPTTANVEENNDNQAEDEFTNPFCTPLREVAESSSRNIAVDHAGCIDTRKSTSGGIQFLGDKLESWMSKKQDYTTMSSAEVEYVALSASCAQVMWMRTQLKDYGFNYNKIPLYCDSQSAIAISGNPVQHSRTKHIHTRFYFIKEQVENGIIELYFVRTEYQLADMFTKALPEDRFKYLVRRIGMRCLTPAELEVLANESA